MSDETRKVPTGPGWWWMRDVLEPVRVIGHGANCRWFNEARNEFRYVTDDGRWIAPVLTPAEVAELRAELAAERGERGMWRPVVSVWCIPGVAEVAEAGGEWTWNVFGHASGVEPDRASAMRAAEAEARRLGLLLR